MKLIARFIFLLILNVTIAQSYRILGIFPYNGKSHNMMFTALMRGLAKRGHQVDDITHFPVKNAPSNYKVLVNLNGTLAQMVNSFTMETVRNMSGNSARILAENYGNKVCELMGLEDIQKVIHNPPKNPPYDLVITEVFAANCYMGFGHVLNVPVVAVSSSAEYPWTTELIGNDDNLAYASHILLENHFDEKNFWDRLKNFISYHYYLYIFNSVTGETETELMRKYLSPDMPNIREVEKNVAMTLVNRHPIIDGIKPVTSSLIEVSGLHIEEDNIELPSDLRKWLDESKSGFVFFSFGSLVRVETLPMETIIDLYKSFAKIAPIRVLMRIADKTKLPSGLPNNVLTLSWIPQQAVLNHEKIRLFITHGGLMGTQEALYYGVPLIGVPLFGDQYKNIDTFVTNNIAVKMNFENITTISMDEALNKVLMDPKYKENAIRYSKLFKDRPMTAMETAVFWIEFVIRNGPNALKSPAHQLNWYQLSLLDVYGFILSSVILILFLVYILIKLLLRKIFTKTTKKTKSQ